MEAVMGIPKIKPNPNRKPSESVTFVRNLEHPVMKRQILSITPKVHLVQRPKIIKKSK